LCRKLNFNAVRQLCPETCGCVGPFEPVHLSGMFASPSYGCAEACTTLWRSMYDDFYYGTGASYPCVDTPISKWELNGTGLPFTAAFRIYLQSVFEFMAAVPNIRKFQRQIITQYGWGLFPGFNVAAANLTDIIDSMYDGRALADLESGIWRVAQGLPISPGSAGCNFFSSLQVRAIWGMDLCEEGRTLGIRALCPQSCGCTANPGATGCPSTCAKPDVPLQLPWMCEPTDSDCPPPDHPSHPRSPVPA